MLIFRWAFISTNISGIVVGNCEIEGYQEERTNRHSYRSLDSLLTKIIDRPCNFLRYVPRTGENMSDPFNPAMHRRLLDDILISLSLL